MAVRADAIGTLTNLKLTMGVSGSTDDTLLETIIDRTSAWIESNTNRKLKARNYNGIGTAFTTTAITSEDYLFFDGDEAGVNDKGYGEFHLPQFPVQRSSVSGALSFELAYLASRDSSGDTFTAYVANVDYILDYERGILKMLASRFTPGTKNYRITATAGYLFGGAQPYVPPDLEQLCYELGKLIYKDRKNLQSETIGSWSRSFATAKEDPFIADILAKYTRLA